MFKKVLSAALCVSMIMSSAVAVYAKPSGTTYITKGHMDFENYSSGDDIGAKDHVKNWDTKVVAVSSDDCPTSDAIGNRVIKISPVGTNAIKLGLINESKWSHHFYAGLGADDEKLLQFKLDFCIPSSLLEEESMQGGLIIMPAQGSYAYYPSIYNSLKYKAADGKLVLADGSKTLANVSTDTWHTAHIVYSFKDNAFRYYLDGTMYLCDQKATAPIRYTDNNVDNYMASGMQVNLGGGLSDKAYILADNLEIYQSDSKLEMSAEYDEVNGKVIVNFTTDIDEEMAEELSLCEKDGTDVGAEVVFTDSKTAELTFPEGYLKYNRDYTFNVVASAEFTDTTLQCLMLKERKAEISFKTPKDKTKIYIEDTKCNVTYSGDSLETSDSITYSAVIGNNTGSEKNIMAGVGLYGENEKLVAFSVRELTLEETETQSDFIFTEVPVGVKYTRLYLWNKNESEISGLIVQPEATPVTENSSAKVFAETSLPDFDVRVTDSLNNELTISGEFAEDADEFVTIAMVKGEAESIGTESTPIALGYAEVNADGQFAHKFTLPGDSGAYTAMVITSSETYTKEFTYMPISTLAEFVKSVADGTAAKDTLCEGTKDLNNGFGIDFEVYFNTEKEIKWFNDYVDQNRSSLTGPTDADYVTQFMTVVNELINRIDFLEDVNTTESTTEMLSLLKEYVKYTSLNFSEYNNLTDNQKHVALSKMVEATFDEIADIKPAFDRFVKAAAKVSYLSKGYSNFDSAAVGSVANNGGGSFEMKFNGGDVQVVDDEVAQLKGETNKALRVAPAQAGKGFYFGLILTGQYYDMKYSAMGLDSKKLLMFGLDVYFPSQMLSEEYMSKTGLNLMPGSGNFVSDGSIMTDSVFKKVNPGDDYLTFIRGTKALKKVETDKWHKINIVYDFEGKTIRYYIDGEMLLKDADVATAIDLNDMGCGIRYVCPSGVSEDFIIYFDNIEIYQGTEAFEATAAYGRDSDDVVVTFTSPIEKSALGEITATVDGRTLADPILSDDGTEVRYNLTALNLKNDKEYSANVEISSMLLDGLNQYVPQAKRSIECKFTTTRSKEMYITDNSKFSGSTYNVEVRNLTSQKEATIAVAEYNAKEELTNVQFKTQSLNSGINTVAFDNVDSTKQVKAFLWTDTWDAKHYPVVKNAQESLEIPIKAEAKVPDFSVATTDAGNQVLTVSGQYSGGADKFVTVIVSNDKLETYETSTVALETVRCDKDGLFGTSFRMGQPSGTYKVYVIIDGKTYEKDFSFATVEDTSGVIKDIAEGKVTTDNIYNSAINYNSGLGIDTTYFQTKDRMDTFNKRIEQNKDTLVGPEDMDYVSQFMDIVENTIAELDYTKELEDVPYAGSIKDKLDEGVGFTNIDFTAYDALTTYQQSLVNENMLRATFKDGDDIKAQFDGFVAGARGKTPPTGGGNSGGSSGGSSSGGVHSTAPGVITTNKNNNTKADLFGDISKNHWAAASIARLVDKKIVSGMGNGNFEPDVNVMREQFVKMAVLGAGVAPSKSKSAFADASDGAWYVEYIMAAKENNIVNGMDNGKFGIGLNITREDMAVIVYNILKKNNVEMTKTDETLSDFDSVSDYAKEAVSHLYAMEIINGMDDGNFAPKSLATRAQAAKIIDTMMNYLAK